MSYAPFSKMPLITVFVFLIGNNFYCQNISEWHYFEDEEVKHISIDNSGEYTVGNLKLDVVWDNKLSYSENIGYYGGIKMLTIYQDSKKLQVIRNVKDNIALGTLYFRFYDYNLDGYLDFSVPINSEWRKYYLFNPEEMKFEHKENWDYLRIGKIDKVNKRILSQQDGNYPDNRVLYQINGMELIELIKTSSKH